MTTTPIPDQPNLRADAYRSNDARATIWIPLAQNLIAGVAIGILGCMALYVVQRLDIQTGTASFAGGLAVACMVTVVRFFADDVGILAWAFKRGRASRQDEIDDLKEEHKEALDKVTDELRAEIERHKTTKRERDEFDLTLRSMRGGAGKYVPGESTADQVEQDAHTLAKEWARRSYSPPTQRGMAELGWTPQRYTMALNYLGSKGVVDRNGTKPIWLVDTLADAEALLAN